MAVPLLGANHVSENSPFAYKGKVSKWKFPEMRRAVTLEAKDFKTSAAQLIAQMNAKLSGREIGEPTHLINQFVTRAAGDDYLHGFQMTSACFIRRTSPCNRRASCLRSGFLSRNCLKCTDA